MSDRPRIELSTVQIISSMGAAVTGAVLTSYLGDGGTILGTAVGAGVSTTGFAVYKHYLARTKEKVAPVIVEHARQWSPTTQSSGHAAPAGTQQTPRGSGRTGPGASRTRADGPTRADIGQTRADFGQNRYDLGHGGPDISQTRRDLGQTAAQTAARPGGPTSARPGSDFGQTGRPDRQQQRPDLGARRQPDPGGRRAGGRRDGPVRHRADGRRRPQRVRRLRPDRRSQRGQRGQRGQRRRQAQPRRRRRRRCRPRPAGPSALGHHRGDVGRRCSWSRCS